MAQAEFDSQLQPILGEDFDLPGYPDGMELLKAFTEKYPRSFGFIRQKDFIDLDVRGLLVFQSDKPLRLMSSCVFGVTTYNLGFRVLR
jgi:hypothetical protein